jgi:hypothetical protein
LRHGSETQRRRGASRAPESEEVAIEMKSVTGSADAPAIMTAVKAAASDAIALSSTFRRQVGEAAAVALKAQLFRDSTRANQLTAC